MATTTAIIIIIQGNVVSSLVIWPIIHVNMLPDSHRLLRQTDGMAATASNPRAWPLDNNHGGGLVCRHAARWAPCHGALSYLFLSL